MSENLAPVQGRTPGQLIRSAREAAGLHIVALAAALKVPVRKLEALEGDRWSELTDATFARALASSVARHLRIDPVPILAGLPSTPADTLDIPVGLGRASQARSIPILPLRNPVFWAVLALLLLAVGVYVLPQGQLPWFSPSADVPAPVSAPSEATPPSTAVEPLVAPASTPAPADTPSAAMAVAKPVPVEVSTASASAPAEGTAPAALAAAPTSPANGGQTRLHLTMKAASWVEVTDAQGKLRIQRVAPAGETLIFEDAASYAVVVGNASGVDVSVNGQHKDLAEFTRNNVARFQAR